MTVDAATREVLLVSAKRLFLKTFARLLENLNTPLSIHEFETTSALPNRLPVAGMGLVVMDAGGLSDDELIKDTLVCLNVEAEVHLLVVIDEPDDERVNTAMMAGASAVMVKASPPLVQVDMLQLAIEGQRCRPTPAATLSHDDIPKHVRDQLSARRQKLLREMLAGTSISAASRMLGMTPAKLVQEMRLILAVVRGRPF